ncbi:hypothetical protein [Brevibacillus sp. SAFN-007a]|uniref:hypothetical protein n=1 Tax=Brevibacillus sp. SAFN-007a TaxID=3436862 RepID=UPI003F7FE451
MKELYKASSQVNTIATTAKVDSVEISDQAHQMLRSAQARSFDWDDITATVEDWYNKGKQWLSDAADFAIAAGKEGLDFLILDDVKTLFNPKADTTDRALAALSLFPAGKAVKGLKLLGKYSDDVAKFADRVLSGKVKVGKYYVKSRIGEDSLLVREAEKAMQDRKIQQDADNLIRRYLEGNNNPGIGNNKIFGDVFELRSRDGARVYLRKVGDTVEILAKSDKNNQKAVIKRLEQLYK